MKKIFFIFSIIIVLGISLFVCFKPKDNRTILTFSSWGSQSEVIIIKNIIKDFENEHKNIKIDFIHIPQNYFQKIHLLFASNLAPDVVFINNMNIQMYIKAGLLEDLTPYIQSNLFYKEALDCFENDGKLYAIPRDISNLVIYYNKDIFREQNIPFPTKIKSLDELKELGKKLTTENYFGINTEDDSLYWLYYLSANGGGVISDDKKSIIITKEESINAMSLYSAFINKYHISPSKAQIGSMTTAQMFINSKLAMYTGGRWMVPKFRQTIDFDWDCTEFPASYENKVYLDASGWAVSKKSKNKEAAVMFIKYLSSKKSSDNFTKSGLIIPARVDSSKSEFFLDKSKKPQNNEAFTKIIDKTKPTPVNENYSTINDIIKEKFQTIISGKKSPQEVFDEKSVKKLESLL